MRNDTELFDAKETSQQHYLPAGCFSSWLRHTRDALIAGTGAKVQCGECNACCTSSYFIHICPEETRALSCINRKLLFPAPGLPKGNVLLGYDKNGKCPMLIDNKCSIYDNRPQTCRNYDCQIFTAAGISAGGDDKRLINQRIIQWKFSYPTKSDQDQHTAVQAAAKFILDNAHCFPGGAVPTNPSQIAILAIKVYGVFLKYNNELSKAESVSPNSEVAEAIMQANEGFEAMRIKQG